ncbi:MAG: hypothetical protein AABZ31_03920 [Bdellovibrionota bacterium]|mgnify:CR=1 FL=1
MSVAKKEVIAEVDALEPAEVLSLVIDQGIEHVVQVGHPFSTKEAFTTQVLENGGEVFFSNPLASIFSPKDLNIDTSQFIVFHQRFSQAIEKKEIIQKLEDILSENVKSASLRADIITIADEMVTNAVFNAPFVDLENSASGASREDHTIKMDDNKSGQMWIAQDDDRVLALCQDDYGTLNPDKMLKKIRHIYETSVAENINMTGRGGAGIGTYMMFNTCISFFVGVQKGKKTIVGCILPKKGSVRERSQMLKNLHFILGN